ncbi:MAG: caspase family protein [Candidatus Woesearchaeota archaeon]|nr:caspase family protein [Candidatus Woesearchaeota archaeon]
MARSLQLKFPGPYAKTFTIRGRTHIGRNPDGEWAREDLQKPESFGNFELCIQLFAQNISRNHAAIYPTEEGYLIRNWSQFGVHVNGQYVSFYQDLATGDKIDFTPEIPANIVISPDHAPVMNNETHEIDYGIRMPNHALLVGEPGWNLQGVKNDIGALAEQLSKRGFKGNIRDLYRREATKKQVTSSLEEAAGNNLSDAHFIFFYSGHGDGHGLCLGNEHLSPSELYSSLNNIRGKKAVILDCCHAGLFSSANTNMVTQMVHSLPPDVLVLASCAPDDVSYETHGEEGFMGKFTRALVHYLDSTAWQHDLRDFGKYLRTSDFNRQHTIHLQEPIVEGNNFTILLADQTRSYHQHTRPDGGGQDARYREPTPPVTSRLVLPDSQ